MFNNIKIISFAILFLLIDFHTIFNSNWNNIQERRLIINKLENLYREQNYVAYYDSVRNFLLKFDNDLPKDLQFKFAYSAYITGQHAKASRIFKKLASENFLTEYSTFFLIKSLWNIDTTGAESLAISFIRKNRHFPISDSLIIPLAESYFKRGQFRKARRYFQMANDHKIDQRRRAEFARKAADCLYREGLTEAALEEYYQVIKKYPSNPVSEELVDWLEQNHPDWYADNLLSIYPVLKANGRLDEARVKLERFIRTQKDKKLIEKARFHLLENYYYQGRYSVALYGFKNLLTEIKNKTLEPKIRLYIARAYLARGNVSESIKSYLDYADRYPRRRMAPEVVWKVALLYERQGKIEKALSLYKKLYKTWRRSSLGKEAYFRQGYSLFRLGRYQEAEKIFNKIRFSKWKDPLKHRAQYWVSLCREISGDSLNARRVRRDLAAEMWDDYYTLKSYLLEKTYLDSTWQIIKELKRFRNPLNYYGKGFQKHIDKFEKVFFLNDLLGKTYAEIELSTLKINKDELQEWIALAEAYKRLHAYGKAYRLYDKINRRFYNDVSYSEKLFILKERFPYYYDSIVEKYCARYGLEKEFVLALIKQESAFERQAQSYANAYGLMQLIPPTAKDMARIAGIRLRKNEDLFEPDLNIHLGTLYLKQLKKLYRGDKVKMLAAYNAGPHRVKRWQKMAFSDQTDFFIENMGFEQTRDYVRHVLKNYWAYKLLYNNFQIDQQKLLTLDSEQLEELIALALK
ncbi:MAG: transglycosylase SLT domain-containing protein [Calditrichaeota bacterium]|nr:transglycosylase SLT domain-containing protein [Calditrichota bacterium]